MRRLALLLCLAAPVMAPAQPSRTITVSGTGRAQSTADRVGFTVGVSTLSGSVTDAVRENNEKTARVVAALKERGVAAAELQSHSN